MKIYTKEVAMGNNSNWYGMYKVCSSEDYKDAFGGTLNGVDTRNLELPCNNPWSLVACEVFDGLYTINIAFFDGSEVHEHTYQERTDFKNAVANVCRDFLEEKLSIEPEALPGLIEVLDACLVDVNQHPEESGDSDIPEESDAPEELELFDLEEDDDPDMSYDF